MSHVEQSQPRAFVVLDDLPLEGLPNFVQTDGSKGMTANDAERAIEILRNTNKPETQR